MQMNYYENLWIELPDGIQKMTEDVLALHYMQERSEREPPAHNKSLHQ